MKIPTTGSIAGKNLCLKSGTKLHNRIPDSYRGLVVLSVKTGADNSRSEAIVLQLEEVFIISLLEES